MLVVYSVGLACALDERPVPPPAVGPASMSPGGTPSREMDTGSTTEFASSASSDSIGTSDAGTVLLSGTFTNVDGGGVELPFNCSIRFHDATQLDPLMVDTAAAYRYAATFLVETWPTEFAITLADTGGVVTPGDVGFVTAYCETLVEGALVPVLVGWLGYPDLPVPQLTLPQMELDVVVGIP